MSALVWTEETSSPATPSTNKHIIYYKADGLLYQKDDTGAETLVAGAGLTNPMTSIGDIIRGTTAGAAQRLAIGTQGQVLEVDTAVPTWKSKKKVCIPIAASDEVTNLTTGTAKVTFRMPFAFTVSEVRASLTVAQTAGSVVTVDVNKNGVTILSTKVTIDNSELTSVTAAIPAVISTTALADDDEITIDIDQVGTALAKGLKVYLIGD